MTARQAFGGKSAPPFGKKAPSKGGGNPFAKPMPARKPSR